MPKLARLTPLLVAGAVFLGACSGDSITNGLAPASAAFAKGDAKGDGPHFTPKDAKKKLAVGEQLVFVFTIDPREDNELDMGLQLLDMPAGAVCVQGSGYGHGTWDNPCSAETKPVTITATVTGTTTYPIVDFQPAMRFNPAAGAVNLYMYAKRAGADDASRFRILYCSGVMKNTCDDESKKDASLATQFSKRDNEVFRRIKHFSGYVVAERGDGTEGTDVLQ